MPATIQTTSRTIQVISPTQVLEVLEIGASSDPSGVFFLYEFPYNTWIAGGGPAAVKAAVDPIGDDIEQMLADPNVAGVSFAQDVNASGLLVGYIEIIVQIPPPSAKQIGPFRTAVLVPIEILGNPEFAGFTWKAQLAKAVAQLKATAG